MRDKCCCSNTDNGKQTCDTTRTPQKLSIGLSDYIKMIWNCLFLFKKAYFIKPGLYFTGEIYDKKSPLLVTCNFLSTVILLYRRLRLLSVRLLVIDTNGINVWCSAGKGRFSSREILDKLKNYDKDVISDTEEIEIILPKLSLSGVKLAELKKNKIRPVIGPVYAKDLKQYLEHPPYKDCAGDSIKFGIKSRLYTVVPTVVQFCAYAFIAALVLFVLDCLFHAGSHWQIIPVTAAIAFFYPVLFPWLPGKRFAVKGISLAVLFLLVLLGIFTLKNISLLSTLAVCYVAFIFGTSIFLALSYTGNSAVSNYSKVKKEIILFLPITVALYIIAIICYFIN